MCSQRNNLDCNQQLYSYIYKQDITCKIKGRHENLNVSQFKFRMLKKILVSNLISGFAFLWQLNNT